MGLFSNTVKDSQTKTSFDIDTISNIFIDTEEVGHVFENNDFVYLFTNKRLIIIDDNVEDKNLGLLSVPYRNIKKFSKANLGFNDLELEIYIWLLNEEKPIKLLLGKKVDTNYVYRILSEHSL
ncbi:MAG: PH domain-containing protein [Bacteroidales bacterium]|nr:PH domain-containing protein [Bacteroidales bacterium]